MMRKTFCRCLIAMIALVLVCLADAQNADLTQRISQLNQQIEVTRPSRTRSVSSMQQLEAVVANRQALVEQLIRTNPSNVRAIRLKPAVSNALPPSLSTLVEADVQLTGVLEQTIADDFENQRSVTQWKLHSFDRRVEVVFPEGTHPEKMLGRTVKISGFGTPNVVAAEEVHSTTTSGVRSAAPALSSASNACSTLGTQNVAVLMMNQGNGGSVYPSGVTANYLQNEYFSSTPKSVPTYWNETSFNLTTAAGQVFGPFTLDRVYSCAETDALATKAITLAATSGVDLSGYSRISIVFPSDSCGFAGLADVGCRASDSQVTHPYSVSWIPIFPNYNGATDLWETLVHELGHNLGLSHGNSLDFGSIPLGTIDYTPIQPNSGTASAGVGLNSEYGDKFTVMGQSQCGGQYSAFAKTQYLNWVPFTDLYEVTTGGNFTVNPYEDSTGPRALRILRDPVTSSWLWIEYRQPQGTYDSMLSGCVLGTNVYQGGLGYYESPYSSDGHLFLLDFHPSAAPNNFNDSVLLPGETWTDPFTPMSVSVTGADANGLSVSVNYSQPCQTVAISSPTYNASGASGSATVTAPSNCSWEATTTANWINFTSPTSGTGNGSVSFNLSNNTNTAQRTGFISVSRRSVAVSQKGTATYIKLMNPSLGSGVQATIPFTFDDPLGTNDVSYARIIFGNSSSCEIDVSQSSGFVGFFVYDATTGSFGPFIAPGDNITYGNGHCSLTGVGSTVTRNGNLLQIALNMTFDLSFAGSHRITASVCDSVFLGCSPDISLGTWLVPLAPSVSLVTPTSGKQGTSLSVTLFGTNTHFADTSTITLSGSGVTVSGISAFSPTQISATLNIDPDATPGARTLTVTSGAEIVSGSFTVGASGLVSVAPTSLVFGMQTTGTMSAPQLLTLTNTGSAELGISAINGDAEFGATNNCGTSLAVNASCTISVTFSPVLGGYRHGNVVINDDSAGSPHLVPLTGLGSHAITILRPDRTIRPTATITQGGVTTLAVAHAPTVSASPTKVTCGGVRHLDCSVQSVEAATTGRIYHLKVRDTGVQPGRQTLRIVMQYGRSRRTMLVPIEVLPE